MADNPAMDFARAANRLTSRWARSLTADSSIAFSGAGVWPIIAILASAADGPAREELSHAAGVVSSGGLKSALRFIDSIRGGDTHVAMGLWTNVHVPLSEWWTANVPSELRGLLTGQAAVDEEELDSWASRLTDGQIQTIGIELKEAEHWQDSTLLVAASALSIDTRWKDPFDVGSIVATAGPWANRHLLSLWRSTQNLNDLGIALNTAVGPLTLVVVGGTADVDVVLAIASERHSPTEVLIAACDVLSEDQSRTHGSELKDGDVAPGVSIATIPSYDRRPQLRVSVPPFNLRTKHTITEYPGVFGLRALMDASTGHLPNVSELPLALNNGVQQVTANFNARGFRAGAVTAMDVRFGAGPPEHSARCVSVVFDRPFAFLARHRPTGLLVVAGLVTGAEDFRW